MNMILKLFLILYGVGWLYIIKKYVLWLILSKKCRHKRNCKKDDCPIRYSCRRTAYSDAEKKAIQEKINHLN